MAEKTKPDKVQLNRDQILQAEFNYIAGTAEQANEDRSRVTSFYFVSAGSFIAAILGTQFGEDEIKSVAIAFFLLFLMLTLMGGLTIAQLARLRAAWYESVRAMNQIKDFYIEHDPAIESALRWRTHSIPKTDKPYSLANLMATQVALLSSLTTGAAVFFLLNASYTVNFWGYLVIAASVAGGYAAQWTWYKYLLMDKK